MNEDCVSSVHANDEQISIVFVKTLIGSLNTTILFFFLVIHWPNLREGTAFVWERDNLTDHISS